jgi:hypothetical protein
MLLKTKEVAERLKRFYVGYPLVRYAGEQQLSARSTFVSALGGILLLSATVLVQREMESWRAPLASITPFSACQFAPPNAVAAGGTGSG